MERLKNGATHSTVNRDLMTFKAAISKAVAWGLLKHHPLAQVKPYKLDSRGIVRYLTEQEEARLREALENRETRIRESRIRANTWRIEREYPPLPVIMPDTYADHLKPIVLLAINTGMRRGELFNLRWQDITMSAQEPGIMVRGAYTKSGHSRFIPLNEEALLIVKKWRKQCSHDSILVFPGENGNTIDNIAKSWRLLLKESKIEDFRFHDLRHHFASRLAMAGIDLNTIRELLGHADLKMTLRYAHIGPNKLSEAVAALNRPTLRLTESQEIHEK